MRRRKMGTRAGPQARGLQPVGLRFELEKEGTLRHLKRVDPSDRRRKYRPTWRAKRGGNMIPRRMLAIALVGLLTVGSFAGEQVGVSGSSTQYDTTIESGIGGKQIKLVLTGAALRKKLIFNVYTVGSYIQEGVAVHSAEELVAADSPKQLHLVMERDVDGKDMVQAFTSAIRANYDDPAFADELKMLADKLEPTSVKKDDHVWLTHVPQVGLHVRIGDTTEFTIKNVNFARAVWEIYLGKHNLGENIKKDLVSRL
jgi:hypothetical protein